MDLSDTVHDANGQARPRNKAFEGEHITPSGARGFKVYYLDREAIKAIRNARKAAGMRVYPPGHALALKTGWYWITAAGAAKADGSLAVGPFSSSRGAYKAAVDKLDNGKG